MKKYYELRIYQDKFMSSQTRFYIGSLRDYIAALAHPDLNVVLSKNDIFQKGHDQIRDMITKDMYPEIYSDPCMNEVASLGRKGWGIDPEIIPSRYSQRK